jgi:hypothetical protein
VRVVFFSSTAKGFSFPTLLFAAQSTVFGRHLVEVEVINVGGNGIPDQLRNRYSLGCCGAACFSVEVWGCADFPSHPRRCSSG